MRDKLFIVTIILSLTLFVLSSCQINQTTDNSAKDISWSPNEACYFLQDIPGLEPSSASKRNKFYTAGEVFCDSNFVNFPVSNLAEINSVKYYVEGNSKIATRLTLDLFISDIKFDKEARLLFKDASLALFKKVFKKEPPDDLRNILQEGNSSKWVIENIPVEIQKKEFICQNTGKKCYKSSFYIGSYQPTGFK